MSAKTEFHTTWTSKQEKPQSGAKWRLWCQKGFWRPDSDTHHLVGGKAKSMNKTQSSGCLVQPCFYPPLPSTPFIHVYSSLLVSVFCNYIFNYHAVNLKHVLCHSFLRDWNTLYCRKLLKQEGEQHKSSFRKSLKLTRFTRTFPAGISNKIWVPSARRKPSSK